MANIPYMPLWVADFLTKTVDLDARESGAYLLLLMALWTRGGTLPNDPKKLQRIARVGRDWPTVWASISHYFTITEEGVSQDRLTEELTKARRKREVNSNAGARGGKAKALKDKKTALANASHSPRQSYTESVPPITEEDNICSNPDDGFDRFWRRYPRKAAKPNALKAFAKAIKKATIQEIMDGLETYIATKPPWQDWAMPASWLNAERWNDEPPPKVNRSGVDTSVRDAFQDIIERATYERDHKI